MQKGVEEEVSDAFPQGGPLDQGDGPDVLGGAGGVEAQHLLVPESLEVLPYRCGVVQGVGFGQCGGWWCGPVMGGLVWVWGGMVVVVACGVR